PILCRAIEFRSWICSRSVCSAPSSKPTFCFRLLENQRHIFLRHHRSELAPNPLSFHARLLSNHVVRKPEFFSSVRMLQALQTKSLLLVRSSEENSFIDDCV